MTTAPQIETKVRATTCTPNRQSVVVYVTAIDSETPDGWMIYGLRVKRGLQTRMTQFPRLYFVLKG